MGVRIGIDLDGSGASQTINRIRGEIQSLEEKDLDLNFGGSLGEVLDELEDFTDQLDDLRVQLDGIETDLGNTLSDLDDAEIEVSMPDGETGATGGEADPPTSDGGTDRDRKFRPNRFAKRVEDTLGLEVGTINVDSLEGFDGDEFDDIQRRFHNTVQDTNRGHFMPGDLRNEDWLGQITGNFGYGTDEPLRRHFRRMALSDEELEDAVQSVSDRDRSMNFDLAREFSGARRTEMRTPDIDMRTAAGLTPETLTSVRRFRNQWDGVSDIIRNVNTRVNQFGGTLRRLVPSMQLWYSLIAAVIPLVIALGVQLLGVASALLAVAAAGAAVIGLGLVGHADDMGSAWEEAQQQLSDLKEELFETFQAPMQQFAPIQAEFFDQIPGMLQQVSESMEGLTVYEDTIFEMFSRFAGGIAEFFNILTRNEDVISQLALRFGSLLGSGILDFFEWLIQTAYENQELLIDLGAVIMNLSSILYHVSMIASRVIAAMRPLFAILQTMAELLDNRLVTGLLTFLATTTLLSVGVLKLASAAAVLGGSLQTVVMWLMYLGGGSLIGGIVAGLKLISSYAVAATLAFLEMASAAQIAAAAIAATGVGVALVAGGVAAYGAMSDMGGPDNPTGPNYGGGGPGTGSGGQTAVYNDNRQFTIQNQGQMDTASEQRVRDTISSVNTESMATETPTPGPADQSSGDGHPESN